MRAISKLLQRCRAQSMVEFALIVPVLIVLILGLIELGYALFVYTEVENAAREGARAAAVRPCPSAADTQAIVDATRGRLPALVDPTTVVPTVQYPSGTQRYGDPVSVSVDYQFQLLDPLTTKFIPNVNVNASASRTLTTDCNSVAAAAPTALPTATPVPPTSPPAAPTTAPGGTPVSAPTPQPTPEPIYVTLAGSKKTSGSSGTQRPLTLRVRVTRGISSSVGVSGMVVTVKVQVSGGGTTNITMPATDSNGYAQIGCSGTITYAQSAQLTLSTDPVTNPPGGVPAPALSNVNVDTSGTSVCVP